MPRCRHSCTSYFGSSSVYPTNSSDAESLKSLIGNTELNTACRPEFSRFSGSTLVCRKRSKVCFWISIRSGMSRIGGVFEKSLRTRGSVSVRASSGTGAFHPPGAWLGIARALFDVDLSAGGFDLLLELRGLFLGDTFL